MRPGRLVMVLAGHDAELSARRLQMYVWGYRVVTAVVSPANLGETLELLAEARRDPVWTGVVVCTWAMRGVAEEVAHRGGDVRVVLIGAPETAAAAETPWAAAVMGPGNSTPAELRELVKVLGVRKRGPKKGCAPVRGQVVAA